MEENVQNSKFIEKTVSDAVAYAPMSTDEPATVLVIMNNTGVDINVRQDNNDVAGTVDYLCKNGQYVVIDSIVNCNQVMVKLATAGSAVDVQGRIYN